jgi:glycosyltransferase involved in cell wall biosynthesis
VWEAIESVLEQTYPNVELIVIDDKSSDNSVSVIKDLLKDYPHIKFIQHSENKGNCKSFNEGWRLASGEFFIDLAADDALPKNRIEIGVKEFSNRGDAYGVQCGDAAYIDEEGGMLGLHSSLFDSNEGDIYADLIERYFVSSASLMIRKEVLEKLNGFDESLAYEDFDFLIRSSRKFKYFYTNEVMVCKRLVEGSMSKKQFQKGSPQLLSTFQICEKILSLNRTTDEDRALKTRVWYEIRQNLKRLDFGIAMKYYGLLKKINTVSRAAYK